MVRGSDIMCAGISVLLGCIASPAAFGLTFLYVSYSYLRSAREACITIFFVLLCALGRGVIPTYFYALGFAAYFVVIHVLKLCNKNLYQWLPYIITFLCSAYSLQIYGIQEKTILLPVMSFILMQQLFAEYSWIRKSYVLAPSMAGIVLFSLGLLLVEVMPTYQLTIGMIMMVLIGYLSDSKTTTVFALLSFYLIGITRLDILIVPVILSICKDNKKNAFLVIISAGLFFPRTVESALYLLLCFACLFIIRLPAVVIHKEKEEVDGRLTQDSTLKRQMQNYANIFQSLADYYTQINDVQAEILVNMAGALQYNADVIRKIDGVEKDVTRIKRALEGYQYDVRELLIEEPKEGCIQITMDINNIKRGEIRTTLLPLLEVLLHRNLAIEEIKNYRFVKGYHHICISDHIPFEIDAYADSVKNSYTSSGDTFSIFKFRQSMVCMISDGMGNGERAAQSSRLITNIFQRMMVCGIPQESAIKCINKLIQSDTFATLDVICFNRAQGVAYISKSAACPTFLLRKGEIHEICGNALPVGIISQMQPDCFQVDLKAGDEYLMVSDGIYRNEIYEWLKKRDGDSIKGDVDTFSEILKLTRRMDDSTIVLARVDEVAC